MGSTACSAGIHGKNQSSRKGPWAVPRGSPVTDLYQQVVRQRWGSFRVYVLYLVLFFGGLYGVSTSVALGTGLAESWNSGQLHTASAVTVLGVMLAALGAVMLLGAVMGPMLGEPFAVWLQDVQGREPPVIAWRMMRGKLCGAFACAWCWDRR